eukprot:6034567-Pyramimonas_sp.AAC.1
MKTWVRGVLRGAAAGAAAFGRQRGRAALPGPYGLEGADGPRASDGAAHGSDLAALPGPAQRPADGGGESSAEDHRRHRPRRVRELTH